MKTYLNINSIQDKSIPGSKLEESYVSQENGKGLSTNDFTDVLKNKLLSLNNYDDSELNEKLLKLEQNLNSILGEGSTEAIENFNEIISFLSGIEDSESLDNIIAAIELQISDKQDKINDLQKIREGASKGETALQEIPEEYITEDELENKGYLTEHQDITPEILQNENEVAIKVGNNTSNYTTINYSKFSNDLTGRIEATPEEFTFRPSAGDKSIRDESALIKKIKGNTIVWNQLAYKTKVYNHGGITYTFGENDVVTVNGTLTGESSRFGWVPLQKNHYYYHRVEVIDMGECSEICVGNVNEYYGRRIFNSIGIYERIVKRNITTDSIIGIIRTNDTDINVTGLTARYQCFDLTQMFGAGNEPTTVEEFKALFPDSYYPYCEPELRSITTKAIETVGFNQFNGEYAEVLPNQTYYLGGIYTTIGFTEELEGTTEEITIADDKLYTPTKKGYIYATGTDICINLSHSGVRNGEYQPYEKHTKDLSIIQKYFPNGMRSAGSICDEISFDAATQKWVAIQRVGERAFIEGDKENAQVITDSTNTYYELAEPIITTIEEPIDLSYKVGDFGIEKMLSDSFSAPFKADIVYQFNATDRVRENSMNISKLSKKHNLLESKALTTEEQNFSNDQKAQVAENLGGNTGNGLVRYVESTIPVELFAAPNASGVTSKYAFPNASDAVKGNANGIIATESFVDEGYIPRPSGTSASKNNKLLAYSDGRTFDSGVGISQDVSDITNSATDSVPTSAQVKEYVTEYMNDNLPTTVATATERVLTHPSTNSLRANIIYDISQSTITKLTISSFVGGSDTTYAFDDVWRLRFAGVSTALSIVPTVRWESGIAPNFSQWAICDLEFRRLPNDEYIGKWTIYR